MSHSVILYGIKNCDTVRKALKWLASHEIETEFHDLKKEPLEEALILEWLEEIGQDKLINKRGLTWRNLDAEDKILDGRSKVINLVQQNPTIVKRPVFSSGIGWNVGFDQKQWDQIFL